MLCDVSLKANYEFRLVLNISFFLQKEKNL